jgi:hypothetical protein
MRLQDVGPNDREYGLQHTISGRMVEDSDAEILGHVAADLMHGWKRAKAQYGFPEDAVPEWRISWYYVKRSGE